MKIVSRVSAADDPRVSLGYIIMMSFDETIDEGLFELVNTVIKSNTPMVGTAGSIVPEGRHLCVVIDSPQYVNVFGQIYDLLRPTQVRPQFNFEVGVPRGYKCMMVVSNCLNEAHCQTTYSKLSEGEINSYSGLQVHIHSTMFLPDDPVAKL